MNPKTNTEDFSRKAEKQPVLAPQDRLARSPHYIRETVLRKVVHSQEFNEKRAAHVPGVQAFTEAAVELSNSPDDMDDFDRSILSLTSRLGLYIDAQTELDDLRSTRDEEKSKGGDISEEDKELIKSLKVDHLLPFNHAIKDLINEYPMLNIKSLTTNIVSAYQGIYGHYNSLHPEQPKQEFVRVPMNNVVYDIETLIDGMRHEIAAESLFAAAGVDYRYDTTDEEDQKGRDLYVEIDGRWTGVDIKASFNREAKTHQKQRYSKAVWTGLTAEDFLGVKGNTPGSVSVPFATAKEHANEFIDRIRKMKSGELGRMHRAPYNAGSRAVEHARH